MALEYIKRQQRQLEKERQLEAEKEAARVAEIEAEARKQEEIAYRKECLLEQQEIERLRQKRIQREEILAEQKWNNQFDTLLAQIEDQLQKNDKLEEIRIIIQNREPSIQELDWESWLLSDPLNQKLAELDLERAMEMFKRDNLLAKRRRGTRGKIVRPSRNYALSFTGDTDAATRKYDFAYTDFNPDDYNLNLGFTVSYWVRAHEVGVHQFAFGRKYSNSERFTFGIGRSNKIYIGVGPVKMECTWSGNCDDNSSGQTAAQLFPSLFDGDDLKTGNWLHFAVTYADRTSTDDGSVARKTYLNGELIHEANLNWNTTGGSWTTGYGDGMYFGARNLKDSSNNGYNNGWACDLDEVAIYDTAKDANWVTSVYSGGTKYNHKNADNLVGYWKFNEGSGTTVKDHSGNGNHGTFAAISDDTTAFPTWKKR